MVITTFIEHKNILLYLVKDKYGEWIAEKIKLEGETIRGIKGQIDGFIDPRFSEGKIICQIKIGGLWRLIHIMKDKRRGCLFEELGREGGSLVAIDGSRMGHGLSDLEMFRNNIWVIDKPFGGWSLMYLTKLKGGEWKGKEVLKAYESIPGIKGEIYGFVNPFEISDEGMSDKEAVVKVKIEMPDRDKDRQVRHLIYLAEDFVIILCLIHRLFGVGAVPLK